MPRYQVKFYYLASGMEGEADERDYGEIVAASPDEAENKVALREVPEDKMYGPDKAYSSRNFFKGCLTAKQIPSRKWDSKREIPSNQEPVIYGAGAAGGTSIASVSKFLNRPESKK